MQNGNGLGNSNLLKRSSANSTHVKDLHLWQIFENERSLILSLESTTDNTPEYISNSITFFSASTKLFFQTLL